MRFKMIVLNILVLILVFSPVSFAAKKNITSPSFDCRLASNYAEKMICQSDKLALKDAALSKVYALYKRSKGKYSLQPNSQINWLKERNACEDVKCIHFLYSSRLKTLTDIIYSNDASYMDCPATSKCLLMERHYLGSYKGSKVILDVVEMSSCYKGCTQPKLKPELPT